MISFVYQLDELLGSSAKALRTSILPDDRRLLSGSRDERSYISSGPCLSAASWSALLPAFIPFNLAGLGVNGFVHFCRNKSGSAAGPKPGNTEYHVDT